MLRRHPSMIAAIAMALAADPVIYGHMQEIERISHELPPHDPNLRIKRPRKSWGRKSKKRGKRR